MMEFLLRAAFEAVGSAIVEALGMRDIVELVSSIFGLACIICGIGYAIWGG